MYLRHRLAFCLCQGSPELVCRGGLLAGHVPPWTGCPQMQNPPSPLSQSP